MALGTAVAVGRVGVVVTVSPLVGVLEGVRVNVPLTRVGSLDPRAGR